MEFRILGPVSAQCERRSVPLDGAKQRATFAALALAHDQVVTDDRLTALLWGWDPPANSTGRLYTYVSRLRTRLGPEHGLTRHGTGYRLRLGQATLDWETFRGLAEAGRAALRGGRYAEAEHSLSGALALWHGPALGGVTEHLAAAEGPRLEEARLVALEHHVDAALALGRHDDLVPGLTGHVGSHPLRGRLRGQLMTALFRSGRQADALAVYEHGRRILDETLGIGPGRELHDLHQCILAGTLRGPEAPERHVAVDRETAAAVAPAEPRTGSGSPACRGAAAHRAVATRTGAAQDPRPPEGYATATPARSATTHTGGAGTDTPVGAVMGRAPVPALLPAAPADFVGRTEAAEAVIAALRGRYDVVITGAPGAGASSLARWVAERCQRDYPEGQLYADLRTGDGGRRTVHEVLGWFLCALGAEADRLPAGADERAQLFRTLVASRRMLIVLDNAADDAQVRPLLPGGGASRTVVTGVHPALASLDAVRLVRLGPMAPPEAMALLASAAGAERLAAEPEAALRVAEFCDRLPLALRIAGARLAARPHWPVARLADRLSVEERRLAELHIGGLDVTRGIRAALESLPEPAAGILRVLASAGLPRFTALHVAALLGRTPEDTEDLLEQLVDSQLLQVCPEVGASPGGFACYRLMSLVRLYSRRHQRDGQRSAPRGPVPTAEEVTAHAGAGLLVMRPVSAAHAS